MNIKNIILGSIIILICYYIGVFFSTLTQGFLSPSVIGMLVLFALLAFGIVKKEWVESVSLFLMSNLVLFFIPALVGATLIDPSHLKGNLWQIVVIAGISTIFVMLATGTFIEFYQKKGRK